MGLIGIVMISGLDAPIDGSKQLQCIEFQLNWTTHHLHCQIELTIKYEAFEGSNHHPWATHVWQTDSYQLVIPRQWSCLLACARSCSLSRSVARARARAFAKQIECYEHCNGFGRRTAPPIFLLHSPTVRRMGRTEWPFRRAIRDAGTTH